MCVRYLLIVCHCGVTTDQQQGHSLGRIFEMGGNKLVYINCRISGLVTSVMLAIMMAQAQLQEIGKKLSTSH